MDRAHFPSARPMFHDVFTVDRRSNIVVLLIPNQPPESVSFAETVDKPFAVLMSTPRQITGDPDIERPFGWLVTM